MWGRVDLFTHIVRTSWSVSSLIFFWFFSLTGPYVPCLCVFIVGRLEEKKKENGNGGQQKELPAPAIS